MPGALKKPVKRTETTKARESEDEPALRFSRAQTNIAVTANRPEAVRRSI
jgi:hypothetical protein